MACCCRQVHAGATTTSLKVWQMDTLKLAIGGFTSHILNIVFALAFRDQNTNPCVWYFSVV